MKSKTGQDVMMVFGAREKAGGGERGKRWKKVV